MKTADEILDAAGAPRPALARSTERHRGQLRMAQRLAAMHEGRLLHVHRLGWYVWDGSRWTPDEDGAPIRAVRDMLDAALAELPTLVKEDRDALYRDIARSESASAMNGILAIAGADERMAAAPGRLDTDPYLLNCANGTLDLRTGELREHDPRDLITKVAGCVYEPGATSDAFARFIAEVLPDEEVRAFVKRMLGQSLAGVVREHVLPIFTGKGKNGKSTLIETVRAVLGDYAIEAEPDLLLARDRAHPTGLADLMGRRLVTSQETDEGRKLAAATVKRLTGGDRIRARRMREDFFEFTPSHTVVMITNHKPRVPGDDDALWRRIRIVPFDVVVDKPDPTLPERLREELPGVLAWLVDGYREYVEHGLTAPEGVTRVTEDYRNASDSIGRFLAERTTANQHAHVRARQLYADWANWCQQNGENPGSEVTFAEAMARRGIEKKRSSGGQIYRGLGLLTNEGEML